MDIGHRLSRPAAASAPVGLYNHFVKTNLLLTQTMQECRQ